MKTQIYNILILLALITACSSPADLSPEIIDNTKTASVSFIIDKGIASKALDVTTANLESIEVTAFEASTTSSPDIAAVTFTGSGSPKVFSSTPGIIWPDYPLDFYAYSTGSATGQVSKTSYNTFVITPSSSPSFQVDFVYACAKNQDVEVSVDGKTPLTFLHAESKVSVKVKNTSSSLKFEIYGWRLGYLDNSATFTHDGSSTTGQSSLSAACWSGNTSPSASNTYTMDLSSSPISVAASTTSEISLPGEMIIIPQTTTVATAYAASSEGALLNGSYVALKLRILDASTNDVIFGEDAGSWAATPVNFNYSPGGSYIYSINIGHSSSALFYETNPVAGNSGLWHVLDKLPVHTFGGLMIAPAPLYYNGSTFVIKDDDWNHESWQSVSGKTSGSYYFDFKDIGPFFSSTGSWTSSANSNIDNLGNKVSYGKYNDWRVPTPAEWQTIIGTSRAGSTVNGNTSKHYSFIRLTGVTHAGNSSPYGVLLFPDNETITGVTLNGFDNTTITSNITNNQLNDYLNQGCAFLPASGWRYRSSGSWERGGQNTYYWSTAKNSTTTAQALRIATSGGASLTFSTSVNCGTNGYYVPVRLVRTAE